ncbi:MAG: alpha-1,2-fucosyltransferase [Proteobacteria bacterium]|nr:alpha-1,2-fucosyltransferase [Pseudomonadota bacterium]
MIAVKVQAGFGNQLFQYAMGYAMARRYDCPLKLDISFFHYYKLKKHLGIKIPEMFSDCYLTHLKIDKKLFIGNSMLHLYELLAKKGKWKHLWVGGRRFPLVIEDFLRCREYQSDVVSQISPSGTYLEGFWQHPAYFSDARSHLQEVVNPVCPLCGDAAILLSEIENRESVGIHIRRGDFIKLGWDSGLNFYCRGISKMRELLGKCGFYVFTDDKPWARENLSSIDDLQIVDLSVLDEFFLLKNCKHQIVSESTFGWWAAYLNPNPDKKIIIPEKFKGCLADNAWIRI